MEKLKGWRTIIFNSLCSIGGIIESIGYFMQELADAGVLEAPLWKPIIPAEWWPFMLVAFGLINKYLRKKTTTPIGKKS